MKARCGDRYIKAVDFAEIVVVGKIAATRDPEILAPNAEDLRAEAGGLHCHEGYIHPQRHF
jgi:hypothetical protein